MWSSSAANEHLLHLHHCLHIPFSTANEVSVNLSSSFILGHAWCFDCLHLAVLANALDDVVFYSFCYVSIAKWLHHVLLVCCCESAQPLGIAQSCQISQISSLTAKFLWGLVCPFFPYLKQYLICQYDKQGRMDIWVYLKFLTKAKMSNEKNGIKQKFGWSYEKHQRFAVTAHS